MDRIGIALALLVLSAGQCVQAQSPGLPAGAGAKINTLESQAMLEGARRGQSLLPEDAMADCDKGVARLGKQRERDYVEVPKSLVDELRTKETPGAVVFGNVYSRGCN